MDKHDKHRADGNCTTLWHVAQCVMQCATQCARLFTALTTLCTRIVHGSRLLLKPRSCIARYHIHFACLALVSAPAALSPHVCVLQHSHSHLHSHTHSSTSSSRRQLCCVIKLLSAAQCTCLFAVRHPRPPREKITRYSPTQ